MVTTGDRIDLARRRRGWTKTRLATELGIKQQSVSALIAGDFPGTSRLDQIATALRVPIEWLTTGHPPQPWETESTEETSRDEDNRLLKEMHAMNARLASIDDRDRARDEDLRRSESELAAARAKIAALEEKLRRYESKRRARPSSKRA